MRLSVGKVIAVGSALALMAKGQALADAPWPSEPEAVPRAAPLAPNVPRFVVSLDQLSWLTEKDRTFSDSLQPLMKRRTEARTILTLGLLIGGGALGMGAALAHSCAKEMPKCDDGSILMPVGLGLAVAAIVGWAVASPSREDFADAVNRWNLRHPAEPIYPY